MNRFFIANLFLFYSALMATPPATNQWELKQKTATGFDSHGLTAENGKAIGFTAGVPAMITVGAGTVTSIAVSGSDGIDIDSGSPITTAGTIALGINASTLKTHLSLNNVENTALSTWAGTTNITTLGTIATGTWNGTVIGAAYGGAGTVSGLLKANGSGTVSAASAGTDYLTPTGDGSGLTSLSASNISSGSLAHARIAQEGATSGQALAWSGSAWAPATVGVSDGDKGNITVSGTGATWTIDSGVVTSDMLAGSIDATKISGTAAILGANTFNGSQTIYGNTNRLYIGDASISGNGTAGRLYIHSSDGFGYSLVSAAKIAASGFEGNSWTSSDGQLSITHSTSSPFVFKDTGSNEWQFKNTTNPQTIKVYGNATGDKYLSLTHNGTDAVISASSGAITSTSANVISTAGAASTPAVLISGAPYTGGSATTTKPLFLIETSGATSTNWGTAGSMLGVNAPGSLSTSAFLIDLQRDGTRYFSVNGTGATNIVGALSASAYTGTSTGWIGWNGRAYMYASSDGVVRLLNNAENDFGRLQLGGTTSSYPAIKRSGTGVAIRLADDSADAPLSASTGTFTGVQTLAAGSVSAPSLTMTGMTSDTGMYSTGTADEIAFAIAGVQKMKIAADKTTLTSTDTLGGVLTLAGYYGTVPMTIDGSGGLGFNTFYSASYGTRVYQYANGANFLQFTADADYQRIHTSSSRLTIGVPSATPAAHTLSGPEGVGTDITGGTLYIGTRGTGTGTSGAIIFQTHAAGASSATPGTLTDRLTIESTGATVIGTVTATTFSGSGASLTGVPISTGVSGLGSNVATFLATPTISNLNSAVSDADLAILGANTFTAAQLIDGSADAVQLTVQGHSTQTNNILLVEKSDGTDLLTIANAGSVGMLGPLNITSTSGASLSVAGGCSFANGSVTVSDSVNSLKIYSTYLLSWASDTFVGRDSAATVQLGQDHATATTNQTIKAHDVTTGTGAALNIRGGNGSTAGGAVTISTSPTTTPTERVRVSASGEVFLNLPTSAGTTGSLWNDGGTVKVSP